MAVRLTHIFEPTNDGLFDPKEHRRLANECPARNLPGVKSISVYRHTGRSMMLGAVTLENWAAIDTWENWWNTPEGDEWHEKFFKTGKLVERIIFEVVE